MLGDILIHSSYPVTSLLIIERNLLDLHDLALQVSIVKQLSTFISKHPLLPPQCGARCRAPAATTTQTDHSRSRTYTPQRGQPRAGSTNPKQQQTLKYMYTNIPLLTETGGRAVAALGGDPQVPSLYRKTSRHNQAGRANQLEPARAEASSNPRCTGSSGVHWSIWSAPIRLH